MAGERLLLLGRGGFIARAIQDAAGPRPIDAVAHDKLERTDLFERTRCVIGCVRHPAIHGNDYNPDRDDPDVQLAKRIGDRPIRFLMLSTRKVYRADHRALGETAPVGPVDAYGRNKLRVEERLRHLLGERLVVLRLANLFGFELEPGRRTFFATMLRDLRTSGQVHLNISPFVERDFLPVERAADLVLGLADTSVELPEVINLGSGIGSPCGQLALDVIAGFGRGNLVVTRPEERDGFVLDVRRLTGLLGPVIDRGAIRTACHAIGRRLRSLRAQ